MALLYYALIVLALYLLFKIVEIDHGTFQLKEKAKKSRRSNTNSRTTVVKTKKTDKSKESDNENNSDAELIKELNQVDAGNLETVVRLLESRKKKGNTTIVQHIVGPQNNNNVDLKFQLNIAPINPLSGIGPSAAMMEAISGKPLRRQLL